MNRRGSTPPDSPGKVRRRADGRLGRDDALRPLFYGPYLGLLFIPFLGKMRFENPLLWAVLIGWVISVILHEFAHGIVAHWGGDYTISERGGLSLNPLQYIDPLFSIVIPTIILIMGGLPLPGGVTYIRRDLLRGRGWDVAVSLAGPGMNLLLFLACAIPLHPAFGWVDYYGPLHGDNQAHNLQIFLGAMAFLQLTALLLNLVPIPPLDGFQALAPFLPPETVQKLSTPPLSHLLFFGFILAIWSMRGRVYDGVQRILEGMLMALGFESHQAWFFLRTVIIALWNHDPLG